MQLIQKPHEEMLRNAREHVRECRAGGLGLTAAVVLEPYLSETNITLEELGITRQELDGWLAEADKIPIELFPQ